MKTTRRGFFKALGVLALVPVIQKAMLKDKPKPVVPEWGCLEDCRFIGPPVTPIEKFRYFKNIPDSRTGGYYMASRQID